MANIIEVYTFTEARKVLRIGKSNGYQLIKDGKLDHRHNGNRILIPRRSIDEFLYGDQGNTHPCPKCKVEYTENGLKVLEND